jgi:hypothetical protein
VQSIPFTAYDIFAYLASGFVVIAAADFAFDGNWVLGGDITLIEGFVWVAIAYIVGHVVSAISATLLQVLFVERRLGHRAAVLLPQEKRDEGKRTAERIFPGYFDPLPEEIRPRVLDRARDERIESVGEGLFLYCDAKMRQRPEVAPVLSNFLNVYAFARNACLACLVAAVLLAAGAIWPGTDRDAKLGLVAAAFIAAVGLLYRYLRFFRLYARDVFLFYATSQVGDRGGG